MTIKVNDKDVILDELREFRDYISQKHDVYTKANELGIVVKTKNKRGKLLEFYFTLALAIGMVILVAGIFMVVFKSSVDSDPGFMVEYRDIVNLICPHIMFAMFILILGIVYLAAIGYFLGSKCKKYYASYKDERDEYEKLNKSLKEYYEVYENPPIEFKYSNPPVLSTIIQALEKDECNTLEEAKKSINGNCFM